jgi:tetratricopeptide (TPR) repeat protein
MTSHWTPPFAARIIAPSRPGRPMAHPTPSQFQQEFGARINRGDVSGAAATAAGCRAAWPHDGTGWLLGSIAALLEDRRESALALVEERLSAAPNDGQCLLQKAECLLALGDRVAAIAAAEAAGANTDQPAALDAVGEYLAHAGEYDRGLAIYDRAIRAAPEDALLLAKRADVHRILGHFDLAGADYQAVLAINPTAAKALKGTAELRRQSPERNSVAAMQAALAAAPPGSTDAAILHFGLAKSHEDLGEYGDCWAHLTAGNRLERARIQYDPRVDRGVIDQVIAQFGAIEPGQPDATGERPIFIVGLPRSGSTLLERILGCHSMVDASGEITAFPESIDAAVARAGHPPRLDMDRYVAAQTALDGWTVAEEYLARTRARRGNRPRFTDKLLTNFLYCAMILRAFPKAHILHVTRHPLAACHAIYRTRFAGTYPFAYDLAEIGEFYIGYRMLMAHWHRVLPGRLLDVSYENIVTSLEATTRRILDHIGLDFEPACLEFHRNPDPVTTTSLVQVRRPIYDSSLDGWQRHSAELAGLRARLEAAGIPID